MNPLNPVDAFLVLNTTSEVIPPRSVCVITGTTAQTGPTIDPILIHNVAKFDGQKNGPIVVTGLCPIYPGDTGAAFTDMMVFCAIKTTEAVPVAGDEWGPVPNQWYLSRKGKGFFASGYATITTDTIKQSVFTRFPPGRRFRINTTSNLSTGSKTSPSSCLADVWVPDPASAAAIPPLIVTTDTSLLGITVANYGISTSTTASGYYGKVEWMPPNYELYWLECKAG